MIWCLSWGSSRMLTDRSEMETAAEAVSVTSSTSTPLPSSSCTSSLCVCSLLRSDRSMVHLRYAQTHTHTHTPQQSDAHDPSKLHVFKPERRTFPWSRPSCLHLCPTPWCPQSLPARRRGGSQTAPSTGGSVFWVWSDRESMAKKKHTRNAFDSILPTDSRLRETTRLLLVEFM